VAYRFGFFFILFLVIFWSFEFVLLRVFYFAHIDGVGFCAVNFLLFFVFIRGFVVLLLLIWAWWCLLVFSIILDLVI